MSVDMEVTIPQALALQAMFDHWNRLSNIGATREVAFYVDGDGNFHPKCNYTFSESIPVLNNELCELARVPDHDSGKDRFDDPMALFDYDSIAWRINGS